MPLFVLSALGLLKRIPLWCWIALGSLLLLVWYGNHREQAGVVKERARWEAVEAKNQREIDRLTKERNDAVTSAENAKTERDRVYALKSAPIKVEVSNYAKSPAGATKCVDPVGLQLGQASIDAANAATAAAK